MAAMINTQCVSGAAKTGSAGMTSQALDSVEELEGGE
jgi:hypothetical protein